MGRMLAVFSCLVLISTASEAFDTENYRVVDLTHAYDDNTIYWPTSPSRFELETLSAGQTSAGYYYSAYSICTPEHGGTHLDAPVHFAEHGVATDELPVEDLIRPAVVIDVTAKAQQDRNYRLTAKDVLDFEAEHGDIEAGTVVLLRTGWSRYWPDKLAYLGDDTPGDASNLSFPSFGNGAAALLVERRGVIMLGVDTASIDYGASSEFAVHRTAAARNVAGLENLANLEALPPTGAVLVALPMKIAGGSGGPVRVIALIPR